MRLDWEIEAKKLSYTGLYDPRDEHDACGVGLIAAVDGVPRRSVVEAAIAGLKAVYHRGAVDADGKTGDGAGIHLQIPQAFFADYLRSIGRNSPSSRLAVGMLFLPKKQFAAQEVCRAIVETEVLRAGLIIEGWRQVPVCAQVIGAVAAESIPEIEQIVISAPNAISDIAFEQQLYLVRKRMENAVRAQAISDFYICSFSHRSLVYKGLFKAEQLTEFYPDLLDARFESAYALFHQRFSTNTAPAWHLAQPFRVLAHNGEINTLRGNRNFMRSHEATFACEAFEGSEGDLLPVIPEHTSDTGALDSVVEILARAGRPLPLAKLIVIPPAWSKTPDLPQAHRDLFAFCNAVSEPWDGPAAIVASDGEWVIAGMDRNGLRPLRYSITRDGLLIASSETGMVPVNDDEVIEKGRLGPGDLIGVNLCEGTLYKDRALKDWLAAQHPYGDYVNNIVRLEDMLNSAKSPDSPQLPQGARLLQLQQAAGYTMEEIESILHPMAQTSKEAIGSMGDDTPMTILTNHARGFAHFFRQNFSQVTNPPIDSLREVRVMSLRTRFGNDGNYLALDHSHGQIVLSESPVLLPDEMTALIKHFKGKLTTISTVFDVQSEHNRLQQGIERVVAQAEAAVRGKQPYILLTDEEVSDRQAAIPMILAVSAVHSHLVRCKLRKKASILVRTAECAEPHALAVLIGAGATVVQPYVAHATLCDRFARGLFGPNITQAQMLAHYNLAMQQGLLKIMSKMGISVVSAYRGGLNFEAVGLSRALVAKYFPGLPSRISGIGLKGIEQRVLRLHHQAFAPQAANILPLGGFYRQRAREEEHSWQGQQIHLLQTAVSKGSFAMFKQYSEHQRAQAPVHLRDLLEFKRLQEPVTLDRVESVNEIRKRFVAPAMSLGALSPEAHQVLAIAMNRIGASSNSGEGGEGPERYVPLANGDNANSTIKQIASARFGVTAAYINSARELQIKVAQGAKPGEGGQLPGFKVTTEIARLRHATPGVMLISPPPHHDIYSIEDLAQLIYDLKQCNPSALVSVKLVSQSGIGTIASGVAKAMADKIVIAGHNGGTGASPWSSIKYAGLPWELGLAEANQVLTLNRLRHRVKLQTDGGLKTGRDIVIAAMLGAEEFALGTAALVAMGCLMVRQCHSNTCPVGITTQDPALRAKFEGTVDKVVHLFTFVAEEVREILASLGVARLEDVVGRADLLTQVSRGSEELVDLDLNPMLTTVDPGIHARHCTLVGRNEVPDTLDAQMIEDARSAITNHEKVQLAYTASNTMRAIGTRLSSFMLQQSQGAALQADQITLRLRGTAGQSLGAFAVHGLRIELLGDANDYVGKGLSGATIIVRPRPSQTRVAHEQTIIGNTVLYGATAGKLFACGQAGERFAVRNSGALAVVEGCGSNGCEYMTGGTVAILGPVGINFGAGMTGGMAFVYDPKDQFMPLLNEETVFALRPQTPHWEGVLRALIEEHGRETGSVLADRILAGWEHEKKQFWQICPHEMKNRLEHPVFTNEINLAASSKKIA